MIVRTGWITALCVVFALAPAPSEAGPRHMVEAARETLATFVAFDTTNPPGNEAALLRWARDSLAADGVEVQLIGPPEEPARTNLIARLPGRDPDAEPLLIVAHVDVVGTAGQEWTTDPLTLTDGGDGYLYGRGVIDNKGMAAACVEILRHWARAGVRWKRDVVLLLSADEESGGKVGTGWLLEYARDELEAGIVLNEGGDVRIVGDDVAYVGLQTTEKIARTFTLVATGPDGHSSMPLPDNAVARLGAAVADAWELRWPMRTIPTTRAFAAAVAPTLPEPLAAAVAAVGAVEPGAEVPSEHVATLEADPFWNAFLRTTCVPTMLSGGTRANALPSRATAKVNCRLLPDDSIEAVADRLRAAVEPYGVTVEYPRTPKVSPVSPEEGRMFTAARRALRQAGWPSDVVVTPFMSTGGTDCRRFRVAGAACYGLLPFPLTADDERRMHGTDERVGIYEFGAGVTYLAALIEQLAKR